MTYFGDMVVETNFCCKAPVTDATLVGFAIRLLSPGVMVTLVLLKIGQLRKGLIATFYCTLVGTLA